MKLQTMIDKRVTCIAKNYKVDHKTMLSINQMDKSGIKLFEAPTDPLDPVFLKKYDEREVQMNSDSDSDCEMKPQFTGVKNYGPKEPGAKRVSMHSSELKKQLINLFTQQDQFKLNEIVDLLNHPVQPLKLMLKELADYDRGLKVYRLKRSLRF